MKVIHLSLSDIRGGAFIAAYRIHTCMLNAGIDSRMWVNFACSGDWTIEGPRSKFEKAMVFGRRSISSLMSSLAPPGKGIFSPSILPSRWVKRINNSDADIVYLHWIQGEMLSVSDIAKIKKPIIWNLHDMWAFCGAEHYTEDTRWMEGYSRKNRPVHESGFDFNRWTWQRKQKKWLNPIHIVAPSNWLHDCVSQSALMRNWPVDLVTYPIDLNRWSPVEKGYARDLLRLPQGKPLLLFGAMGGAQDFRKGFDLLTGALDQLLASFPTLEIIIFGQMPPRKPMNIGFPLHYMGHLYDDISLRLLYSASDVFALPSRQDNLPLTCMEALSCGTPIVAFNSSGPPSMIKHKKSGYLANPLDVRDFAQGIHWLLEHQDINSIRKAARDYAEKHFDSSFIAKSHLEICKKLLNK